MRIRPRVLASCALAALMCGCAAGPHQVRRSVDDWDNQLYVNSPWWNACLWIVPVIPTLEIGGWVVDFLITDPWFFWFDDAWDGAGTSFEHLDVQETDGYVQSLLMDRAGWTRAEK